MFIEPTITWVPSGFSGYIWLDTKIVLKKKKKKKLIKHNFKFELKMIQLPTEISIYQHLFIDVFIRHLNIYFILHFVSNMLAPPTRMLWLVSYNFTDNE